MLETPEERIEMLKAGVQGKTIEELYVAHNNFKNVRTPLFFELVEIDAQEHSMMETGAEYIAA